MEGEAEFRRENFGEAEFGEKSLGRRVWRTVWEELSEKSLAMGKVWRGRNV